METNTFNSTISGPRNWWISLLLGILYLFAGLWVFRTPIESFITLSILFSAFILVSGIFEITFSLVGRKEIPGWGWYLIGGILDLIIGALLLAHPQMTIVVLPFFVGFWLLFRSVMAIGFAFQLNSYGVTGWGWLLFIGILTLIFSILLLANPIFAGLSIIFMTGSAFLFMGIFRIFLAFDLKKVHKNRIKDENNIDAF